MRLSDFARSRQRGRLCYLLGYDLDDEDHDREQKDRYEERHHGRRANHPAGRPVSGIDGTSIDRPLRRWSKDLTHRLPVSSRPLGGRRFWAICMPTSLATITTSRIWPVSASTTVSACAQPVTGVMSP